MPPRKTKAAPPTRLAIIGVGLMGGSVALAARRHGGVGEVVGYDSDPHALDEALRLEVITRVADSPEEAAAGADVVLVATPVRSIPELVERCAAVEPQPRLITDLGSTKSAIIHSLSLPARRRFVGGHPICGAETAGVRFARANLFEGVTFFLSPPRDSAPEAFELLHTFVAGLGARPVIIDAEAHDRIMAWVSHVPHVLANVLMAEVGAFEAGGRRALFSVGPSFKDLTRVAGANPEIWGDIFLENREALVRSLRAVSSQIADFCHRLEHADEESIGASIGTAARYREELLQFEDLSPETLFRLTVRIPDEPGVLSRVMSTLGEAQINIEDLTMHHFNRAVGADLVMFVSGEAAATTAESLLTGLGYPTVIGHAGSAGA
jgi:prephenate dehydrogenase